MTIPHDAHPVSEGSRIYAMPAVRELLDATTPEGDLARTWTRFARGLVGDGVSIDEVALPDVRCFELEDAGFPQGLAGLKAFREAINAAMPDEWAVIVRMKVDPMSRTVETELHAGGTQTGELMGIPPTGKQVEFGIRTLGKFDGDRLARRWDRTDFASLMQQLREG